MKFITTIIAGVIVGALGIYFTLDWQEEDLIYSITSPAKFGEINFQNLNITNTGWNPAINIKLHIEHPDIKFENIQSKTALKSITSENDGVVSIERIRRDETVTISLAYKGQPLFGSEVKVASDRSVAELVESESKNSWSIWITTAAIILVFWFTIGILASISIPAYRSYIKRAKEVAEAKRNDL